MTQNPTPQLPPLTNLMPQLVRIWFKTKMISIEKSTQQTVGKPRRSERTVTSNAYFAKGTRTLPLDHHVAPHVGFSKDPRESNMLLIDFNRSEDLQTSKLRDDSHQYVRTVGVLRS
jgi:hypothetical protein